MLAYFQINIIVSSAIIRESDDFDIIEMARNNLLGLTHLVEAVRNYTKIMKFIYISSEEVCFFSFFCILGSKGLRFLFAFVASGANQFEIF